MSDDRFRQNWLAPSEHSLPENASFSRYLETRLIDGVIPPDERPGAGATSIHEALREVLFDTPDAADGAPLYSYALLDAARIPGLPELLETTRLGHRCLFHGDDEVRQAAPWLVQLQEDDKFTRNLFRQSNKAWHLWGRDCGIFLRSTASLDELVAHLRRFTKIRDQRERWLFFRFWDPLVASFYFPAIAGNEQRIAAFFRLHSGAAMQIIAQSGPEQVTCMGPVAGLSSGPRRAAPVFDASDEARFIEIAYLAFGRQLSDWLVKEYPDRLADRSLPDRQAMAHHVIAAGRRVGLTMKEDFAFLAQMMMTSGGWFLEDGYPDRLCRLIADSPAPKAQALATAYADIQKDTPQAKLLSNWTDLRAYLADLPDDQAVTPETFRRIATRFLPETAARIPEAIASTRKRLGEVRLSSQRVEGRAMVLTLLLGPRFFEDPFKAWSGMEVEAAIDAAWREVTK